MDKSWFRQVIEILVILSEVLFKQEQEMWVNIININSNKYKQTWFESERNRESSWKLK